MDLKKVMNTEYFGSWDFQTNEKKNLQIKDVVQKEVFNPNKQKDELAVIMSFKNYPLGMFLNATNSKMLIKLFGTSETDNYKGKIITLITKKIKVRKEWIEAVRIDNELPPQNIEPTKAVKVDFNPQHKGWAVAVDMLKNDKTTIEQIKQKYILSEENKDLLMKELI